MLNLGLGRDGAAATPLRILALGAHSDDIEIGCGATLLSLIAAAPAPSPSLRWVVFSAPGARADEARSSAASFLAGASNAALDLMDFRDGFFPYQGAEIKERFEELKSFEPDVVFTHRWGDRHQDHRLVSELSWNTFRDHLVLEYEIPKYDGDLGTPNFFIPVTAAARLRKIDLLMEHFGTQRSKGWFTRETFEGLMRLRGVECASRTGYAEAFDARKITIGLTESTD